MAVKRQGRARKRESAAVSLSDRLREAEATLDAIRTGRVDALVVTGPHGEQTRTIEGATHPYFVLLNAMSDGAALLEADGTILFGNARLAHMAGAPLHALGGSAMAQLVPDAERARFTAFLETGTGEHTAQDFTIVSRSGSATPVAVALSALAVESSTQAGGPPPDAAIRMAIIVDLTFRKEAERTRTHLLERLIAAEDDERRRIARELHDETGQSLAALLVGLRTIADQALQPEDRAMALRLRDVAAQTMEDVSRISRGLHPSVLDDMGLEAAVGRYARDYVRWFGTRIDVIAAHLDEPPLPSLVAATAYRIVQEALTNVSRHAGATRVEVKLRREDAALEVVIRDNGSGFDAAASGHASARLGLRGMRERVTLLGGNLGVRSKPGKGTAVHARIPLSVESP
jgi:signal transduction histidine kinase